MANTGIIGVILAAEDGAPIAGLNVVAYDKDGLFGDEELGKSLTDASGQFHISYAAGKYGLEANPDLLVRVYDVVKRLLYESAVVEDVTQPTLSLPPIQIHRQTVLGFAATLAGPVELFKSTGNEVEFLVDNEEAWSTLAKSLATASDSIRLSQLHIDAVEETKRAREGPRGFLSFDLIAPHQYTTGVRVEQALVDASRHGVHVSILLNDFRLFFRVPLLEAIDILAYPIDTSGHFEDFLESVIPVHSVKYCRFRMPLVTPMHAKLAIFDGREAYTIGSPFIQEYFDDSSHRVRNAKRGAHNLNSAMKVPIHDVSCVVRGPAVAHMDQAFCLHWNEERGVLPSLEPTAPPAEIPGGCQIQVVRSLRGEGRFSQVPDGETGILESYLRAIARAENLIYIEDQYLTCEELIDALVLAMKHNPTLELILVLNNKVDLPLYDRWQEGLLKTLMQSLKEPDRVRVGIFTLWTHEVTPEPVIVRNYIHSKVAIVDDRWATVGSANCDGVSLSSSQHLSLLETIALGIPGVVNALEGDGFGFGQQRSSEVNVSLFNDDGSPHPAVEKLRRRLWAEHFGLMDGAGSWDTAHADLDWPSDRRMLPIWNTKAAARIGSLQANARTPHPVRILPYPNPLGRETRVGNAARYLQLILGQDAVDQFKVLESVPEYSFQYGTWKE